MTGAWPRARPALLALALAGCSPVFNWREVPIADDGLVVLLPCKPDRATRTLPFGAGEAVAIDMAGCVAGGATFAVAHLTADGPQQAQARLVAWRDATRAQWQDARAEESPGGPPRAAPVPAPVQLAMEGAQVDGRPAQARFWWFAQTRRDGSVALYQATVLDRPNSPEAARTFFEGLRLP